MKLGRQLLPPCAIRCDMAQLLKAEREGFEPSIPLRVYRFSRPTHSTTLPPLRVGSPPILRTRPAAFKNARPARTPGPPSPPPATRPPSRPPPPAAIPPRGRRPASPPRTAY